MRALCPLDVLWWTQREECFVSMIVNGSEATRQTIARLDTSSLGRPNHAHQTQCLFSIANTHEQTNEFFSQFLLCWLVHCLIWLHNFTTFHSSFVRLCLCIEWLRRLLFSVLWFLWSFFSGFNEPWKTKSKHYHHKQCKMNGKSTCSPAWRQVERQRASKHSQKRIHFISTFFLMRNQPTNNSWTTAKSLFAWEWIIRKQAQLFPLANHRNHGTSSNESSAQEREGESMKEKRMINYNKISIYLYNKSSSISDDDDSIPYVIL